MRIFVTAGDVDRIVSVCTAEGTAMGGVERIDTSQFADILTISTLIPVNICPKFRFDQLEMLLILYTLLTAWVCRPELVCTHNSLISHITLLCNKYTRVILISDSLLLPSMHECIYQINGENVCCVQFWLSWNQSRFTPFLFSQLWAKADYTTPSPAFLSYAW